MEQGALLRVELQGKLLRIAREAIYAYLTRKKIQETETLEPELLAKRGAFVTLKKGNALRGCMGQIEGTQSLYKLIRAVAIGAATRDPRFPPLKEDELKDIQIEISVLSSFQKISDPGLIQIGFHGILVKRGLLSGLLLPQVATEYGWDALTFLEHTCRKAYLPGEVWKHPETEVYIFTAQVFKEEPTFE